MREFFDTSVLVAAFLEDHIHHLASFSRFSAATKSQSACGIHALAEIYAVMTALPVRPMIPPEQALLFVGEVRDRLTVVTLTTEEYIAAIENSATRGFSSGRVYDALLLASRSRRKRR